MSVAKATSILVNVLRLYRLAFSFWKMIEETWTDSSGLLASVGASFGQSADAARSSGVGDPHA